jgi:transcriptional regulator NrdR family protein
MVCPTCGTLTNCRAVSSAHDLIVAGLAPEYAMKRSISGKDFDVYKRVRECAECSDQFATFEIADEALDRIIDHLANNSETQLEKFKASVIAEITKLKLPQTK